MSLPTSANKPAENKMGTMPVNRLIINMSLPMIISMLVQALYNVVDSIFVVRVSQDALTAVSLALPSARAPAWESIPTCPNRWESANLRKPTKPPQTGSL